MKYYYTIGEVSNLIGVKPYVIRYWETEFPQLNPRKDKGRIRKYNEDQISLLKKIKHILYEQRFTIEGARQKLKSERRSGEQIELVLETQKPKENALVGKAMLDTMQELKNTLQDIKGKYENYLRRYK